MRIRPTRLPKWKETEGLEACPCRGAGLFFVQPGFNGTVITNGTVSTTALGQGHRRDVDSHSTHVVRASAILGKTLKAWLRKPLLVLFSYFLLASPAAFAAVAVDTTSTSSFNGNSTNKDHTTSGVNRLMLVGVSIQTEEIGRAHV